MRTWSAEHALDGLLTGLGNIAGISASAILEILWPTPVDPAEQLAEREAEEEVAEPRYTQADVDEMVQTTWAARNLDEVKSHTCIACHAVWYDEDHDHQCPTLQDAEPRYIETRDWTDVRAGKDVQEDAEPKLAPMPCCGGVLFHHHCQYANARRAAEHAVGREPHPVPRSQRIGTYCEDYEENGCSIDECPTGCYHALDPDRPEPALSDDEIVAVRGLIQERYGEAQRERLEKLERDIFSSPPPWGVNPGDESAPHSQAAASPATVGEPPDPAVAGHFNLNRTIASVLSWHQFRLVNHSSIGSADHCGCGARPNGIYEWEQHVAPFIAECFTAQPK